MTLPDRFGSLARDLLEQIKKKGVRFGDLRYHRRERERLVLENGELRSTALEEAGVGIRVVLRRAQGFAATNDLSEGSLFACAKQALRTAQACERLNREELIFAELPAARGTFAGPCAEDPFNVPLAKKIGLLRAVEEVMPKERILHFGCGLDFWKHHKYYVNTEGSQLEQTFVESGAFLRVTVHKDGEVQHRSYPNSHGGNYHQAGYEFIEGLHLSEEAPRVYREAIELLDAPPVEEGETTLLIMPDQMALQIHESVGHAAELDRILGMEVSLAGKSYLTVRNLGNYQVGSKLVNIAADATTPGGLGTFGWDDEGVPAQATPLVQEGVFTGALSSRETAPRIGAAPSGACRADGYHRLPLIRMVNINLLPGEARLKEVLSEIKHGYVLHTNRSWSIDAFRHNFHFSCERAERIHNGRIVGPARNPIYAGTTRDFWSRCVAVGCQDEAQLIGLPNCGKGLPGQSMHVGHQTPWALFEGVSLGRSPRG